MRLTLCQPSGPSAVAPTPCLPEISPYLDRAEDIGTLWNWPHCGLPPAFRERQDGAELLDELTDWWSNIDLFVVPESGEPHALERGLVHLLQVGLLCREIEHVRNESLDADIYESAFLLDDQLQARILDVVVSEANSHKLSVEDALNMATEDDILDSLPGTAGLDEYNAQPLQLTCSVAQHEQRLLQDSNPSEPYLRAVQQTLSLDARDRERVREHAAIRVRQNKDNRQRTGEIHPPRPPPDRPDVPDLDFVEDVMLPDVSDVALPSKRSKPRKRKPANPRISLKQRIPAKGLTNASSESSLVADIAKPKSRGRSSQRRKAPVDDHPPPRKRRRMAKARIDSSGSEGEAESFDINFEDSHDGDASDRDTDRGSGGRQRDRATSHIVRRRSTSLLGSGQGLAIEQMRPVSFDAEGSPETPAPVPKARPRPRRVPPGQKSSMGPGVSTAFALTGTDNNGIATSSERAETPSCGTRRRSSLRSSTSQAVANDGPRTRSRSRSVRFAEGIPALNLESERT